MAEAVTFEQQRFSEPLGQGVGQTIAEIQASPMTSLAITTEGLAIEFSLFTIQGKPRRESTVLLRRWPR